MIDPRNPAFLINDKKSWEMSKWAKFHWRWWVWVFWRTVWVRRYRAALAEEIADRNRLEQQEAEAQDKAHPQIRPMTQLENAYMDLEGKLGQANAHIEALEKEPNEWQAATRHLLEHYPEDVFPPNSNTPDAKAGTFARRLLTWLLDPAERARLAALAAGEEKKP